ncbi:hypothetical protein B0H19DRAFT_585306 [Mycena capillaripes]|nr:hypothetical protein B0H19DRAFT_585306 [Mycena capillaripes]
MSLPSAPTPYPLPPFEPVFEPELLEPLHDIETPASVSLALPPLDCANTEMGCQDEEPSSWERAGTCSPMEISPICSPTKFLSLSPPCADLPIRETAFWDHQCELIALRLDSNPAGRRRSDSLSSTSSSMAISACSSPTKFISFGQEPPLPPAKQAPPDILCSLIHRGLTGESEHDPDLHLSQDCCPLTSSMRPETENVGVAQESMFWPGRSFVFTYAQYRRKPLQSLVQLD